MIRISSFHFEGPVKRLLAQNNYVTGVQNCNSLNFSQFRNIVCCVNGHFVSPHHHKKVVYGNNSSTLLFQKALQHQNWTCLHKRQFSDQTWKYYTSLDFPPVRVAYNYFETVHDFTGLPWWATVIISTVLLRTVLTLPLYIVSQATIARYKNVQKDLKDISNELKAEVFHYSREHNLSNFQSKRLFSNEMKRHYTNKVIEENCHPFRAILVGLVQVPAWLLVSFGLRNMCGFTYGNRGFDIHEGFTTGGILWFTDLTVADPTLILPVLLGFSNLLITEIVWLSNLSTGVKDSKRTKVLRIFLRSVSVGMIGLGAIVPSAMCLYWTTSSLYGAIQNIVILQPKVRRALNIPWVEGESEQPIRDITKMAKIKYLKKSEKIKDNNNK